MLNSLFLELLEFSEDRNRWESVEEKLNAIRYELLVCFYRSSVHPSFLLASRLPFLSPSVLTSLSSHLRSSLPASTPSISLVHCLPSLSLLLPSPCFLYLSALQSLVLCIPCTLHALHLCLSRSLLFYLPHSLPLVFTQRTHAPIQFHSFAVFLTCVILIFRLPQVTVILIVPLFSEI